MTTGEGFLVVLRSPDDIKRSPNRRYRGVDRTPPWSQEKYEQGFNDPYVFGDYTQKGGLVPTLELAERIQNRFTEVGSSPELEIIYVRFCEPTVRWPTQLPGFTFLGYDVAGIEGPFWSMVKDFPLDPAANDFLALLNENGLFNSVKDGSAYLETYCSQKWPDYDLPVTVCEVYFVK